MTTLRGLYAITPEQGGKDLNAQVRLAISGGAQIIQYRDKSKDHQRRLEQASALNAICRKAGVPLVVNDDVDLAATIGAAGVHLGRDDGDPVSARQLLGPRAIIGVSCYNHLDLALAARDQGADYVAFGSFFASGTKPLAVRADIDLLRRARRDLRLPLVAIGGITPENGADLIAAGADLLAVVAGIFGCPDPEAAARAYARLFDSPDTNS